LRFSRSAIFGLFCIVLFGSCAHQMGVYTRRWAGNAPAGEAMFVDNVWIQAKEAGHGAKHLIPQLFQKRGDSWKWIQHRFGESPIYAPFNSAPWFFLQLPEGEQIFKIELGDVDWEIPVRIEAKTISVIPFVITPLRSEQKGNEIKMIFAMKVNPVVTLPFFDSPEAEAALTRALDSDEPGVRYRACRELEKLRKSGGLGEETVGRLKRVAVLDPIELVREGAEKALGI